MVFNQRKVNWSWVCLVYRPMFGKWHDLWRERRRTTLKALKIKPKNKFCYIDFLFFCENLYISMWIFALRWTLERWVRPQNLIFAKITILNYNFPNKLPGKLPLSFTIRCKMIITDQKWFSKIIHTESFLALDAIYDCIHFQNTYPNQNFENHF